MTPPPADKRPNVKRTTAWLDDNDRANIAIIKQRFGLKNTAAVICYALHDLARRIEAEKES